MVEKVVELTQLYDFYGELLTAKQKDVLSLYLMEDLSLVEIAEQLSISRQAVYDHIAKCTKILRSYEVKLGLLDRFIKREAALNKIADNLAKIENTTRERELATIISEIRTLAKV